jgi:hypothetical protein
MGFDSEENELTRNFKISPALVIIYSLLGLVAFVMSGLIFYYIYQIFK